jgi:hypothetical protein
LWYILPADTDLEARMEKLFIVGDVEATGPNFAKHNMYQFGYVPLLADGTTFPGKATDLLFRTKHHFPETLEFLKRDLCLTPEILEARPTAIKPKLAMEMFADDISDQLKIVGAKKAVFLSDNLAFDWGYMHFYCHTYLGQNPLGYAGRDIPSISMGMYGSREKWEEFRSEDHIHGGLEDARGNTGALVHMIKAGLKLA